MQTAKKKNIINDVLVKEILRGMLSKETKPSPSLRKALGAAIGKTESDIYEMGVTIHSQIVGYYEDPFVAPPPSISDG